MKKVELMEHNKETYAKIKKAWKVSNKTAVIQPTGTGKSYLIAKIVEDNKKKDILILSPSTLINEQFTKIFGKKLDNVQLATYDLINYRRDDITNLKKDIIILDEFHRCGAKEWGKSVDELLKVNSNAKILGASATPIRYLDKERNMSDELFDGNIANTMRLSEAIVRGILPMPKYVTALYTLDEEFEKMFGKIDNSKNTEEEKEGYRKELNKARHNLDKAFGIPHILKKHVKFNSGKMIVFCKDKKHQEKMIKIVGDWFRIIGKETVNYVIHSDNSDELNKQEIKEFTTDVGTEIKLLFTIDMFNEGLHLDNIDGVILLRPTTSPIIFYQQIGRAIDAGSKTHPLILDLVANIDNLFYGNFKAELEETIVELKKGKYKNEVKDIDLDFFLRDETKDVLETFNRIEYRLTNSFDYMFNLLCEYKEEKGDCNVTKGKKYKNEKLGGWVSNIRTCKRIGKLDTEREKKLNSIGFIWEVVRDNFEKNSKILSEYKKEFGDCNVHDKFEYKGINLGKWVGRMRYHKKIGRLTKDREEILNEIGLIWDVYEDNFENMFNLLHEYKDKFGDCNVKYNYMCGDKNLYTWINTIRQNRKKGEISKDREKRLDKIGFMWEPSKDRFEKNFKLLCEYKNITGDCNVTYNYKYKGVNLGIWVSTLKDDKRKDRLDKEREKKLESIGIIWDYRENRFETNFKLLSEYKNKHGDCNVTEEYTCEGVKLGIWVRTIRNEKRAGKLDKEREKKLTELGFIWEPLNYNSDKRLKTLMEYVEEFRSCSVPRDFEYKGINLGSYINNIRRLKRDGKLDNKREEKLNSIGFVWEPSEFTFKRNIELLKEYKKEFGDCKVKAKYEYKGIKLGSWVNDMKKLRKNGKLSKEREEMLDELGFAW